MSEENYVAALFKGTVLEKGYGYSPREIMRDPNLSKGAKVVYAYLMSFAGDKFSAFPKVSTICHELAFKNQGTYYKYLNELKANGLVYTELVKNEKGKFDKNIFYLTLQKTDIEKIKEQIRLENTESNPYFKNCSTEKRSTKKRSTENRSTNINTNNKNNININNNIISSSEAETIYKNYKDAKGSNKGLSVKEKSKLNELMQQYSKDLVIKAIDETVMTATNFNLKYVLSCLESWVDQKGYEEYKRAKNVLYGSKNTIQNKTSTFNDFKQRNYDFKDLEKKLLGWDNIENE